MYRFMTRYGTMAAFGLGLLIAVIYLFSVLGGLSEFDALSKETKGTTSIFNAGLYGAILLVILCFAAAVIFGIVQLASNPRNAIRSIGGLVLLGAILFLGYSLAGAADTAKVQEKIASGELSENVSKLISGALWAVLALAALAAGSFVFSEIRNLFK